MMNEFLVEQTERQRSELSMPSSGKVSVVPPQKEEPPMAPSREGTMTSSKGAGSRAETSLSIKIDSSPQPNEEAEQVRPHAP